MRNLFAALLLIPLISCADTKKEPKMEETTMNEAVQESSQNKMIDHGKWDALLRKHVSASGDVDYKGFKKDEPELDVYLAQLAKKIPNKSDSKNSTLAYWINAYNAFTVKLILENYPLKSIKDIKDPWGKKFIQLEGNKYSLEQIENEILRKMSEPRIHFAINCASESCPNLINKAYTDNDLDKQLDYAASSFINDKTKETITPNKVEVSKIFDWFSDDFKQNGSVIDYLNKYSKTKINPNAKISYKDYDWDLND